jgi:NADPH-dependent 2,4-dienoyl-CoA reductase/sulfur reductase-like enzyme
VVRGPRWFYPFTDEAAGRMVADELRDHDVDTRFSTRVLAIIGDDGAATGVLLDDGSEVPADLVTTSLGARWEMDWFERAGGRSAATRK